MVGFFGRFREKVRSAQRATCCPALQEPLTNNRVQFTLLQVSEVSGPAGHFKATSNDRVNLMYKEAGEFARRLQKCSNQIKAVESATAGGPFSEGQNAHLAWWSKDHNL